MTALPRPSEEHPRRAMLHALTDVVVGEPWRTAQTPWPRTREHTLATSALLWQHLRDELSHALSLTGRALPGPLPAGDIEDDPDTGFVEHLQGVS